jgi:hypothetical protein
MVKHTSLCGLGQSAPNPVLSTLRYFRDEYEALIRDGEGTGELVGAKADGSLHVLGPGQPTTRPDQPPAHPGEFPTTQGGG